jgi:hypothetical protein
MSWMDGSVWASSQRHSLSHNQSNSNSNGNGNQLEGIGIENQNSIRIENSVRIGEESVFRSVGMRPPSSDLALSYKNEQNKRSIFNPGQICAQANQIYQNVNELMKNRGVSSPTHLPDKSKSLKRRIFKGGQEEERVEKAEKSEKGESGQEGQKGYVPSFANNLVESFLGECPPSAISKAPSSNIASRQEEKEAVSTEDQDCVMKSKADESSINFGFV